MSKAKTLYSRRIFKDCYASSPLTITTGFFATRYNNKEKCQHLGCDFFVNAEQLSNQGRILFTRTIYNFDLLSDLDGH